MNIADRIPSVFLLLIASLVLSGRARAQDAEAPPRRARYVATIVAPSPPPDVDLRLAPAYPEPRATSFAQF